MLFPLLLCLHQHKVRVETSNLVKSKVANTDLKDFFKANLKLEENGWNGESNAQQNFSKYKIKNLKKKISNE